MNATSARLSCAIWGHVVDNELFRIANQSKRRCRCGVEYLRQDGTRTHVRHTLSCFLRHHTYVRLADRDGAHEYVCVKCGHPAGLPRGHRPVHRPRAVHEESAVSLRVVRPSRSGHCDAGWFHGIRVRVRSQLPESIVRRKENPPSAALFLPRTPGAIPGETMRLCRIRVRRLRPSVLLRGRERGLDGGLTPITRGFLTPGRVIFWRLLGFFVSLNFGILTAFPVSADRYSA